MYVYLSQIRNLKLILYPRRYIRGIRLTASSDVREWPIFSDTVKVSVQSSFTRVERTSRRTFMMRSFVISSTPAEELRRPANQHGAHHLASGSPNGKPRICAASSDSCEKVQQHPDDVSFATTNRCRAPDMVLKDAVERNVRSCHSKREDGN